jgi:hypothetical protein
LQCGDPDLNAIYPLSRQDSLLWRVSANLVTGEQQSTVLTFVSVRVYTASARSQQQQMSCASDSVALLGSSWSYVCHGTRMSLILSMQVMFVGRDKRCKTVQKLVMMLVTASDFPEDRSHVVRRATVKALILERRHRVGQVGMKHLRGLLFLPVHGNPAVKMWLTGTCIHQCDAHQTGRGNDACNDNMTKPSCRMRTPRKRELAIVEVDGPHHRRHCLLRQQGSGNDSMMMS